MAKTAQLDQFDEELYKVRDGLITQQHLGETVMYAGHR